MQRIARFPGENPSIGQSEMLVLLCYGRQFEVRPVFTGLVNHVADKIFDMVPLHDN